MLDWLKTLNLELQMLDHIEDVKTELGIDPTKVNNLVGGKHAPIDRMVYYLFHHVNIKKI